MTHRSTEQLDSFETRLLTALREEVAGRAPAAVRHRKRWSFAAAGALAVAAIGAAFVLQPAGAYAVDRQGDGDVVVTIRSLSDADGLERALRAEGVEAEVDYDPNPVPVDTEGTGGGTVDRAEPDDDGPSLSARSEDGRPVDPPADGEGCSLAVGIKRSDHSVTFRISAALVESDAVLHITTRGAPDALSSIQLGWEQGSGPC